MLHGADASVTSCPKGLASLAEHAKSEGLVDLVHGDSFEFRDSPAPVGVCDHVALETFPIHEAAQEEVAHNIFAVKHEEREEGPVPDDFRESLFVKGVRFKKFEGLKFIFFFGNPR